MDIKVNKKQAILFIGWLAMIWLMNYQLPSSGLVEATVVTTLIGIIALSGIILIGDIK